MIGTVPAAAMLLMIPGLPLSAAVSPHQGLAAVQVSADPYTNVAAEHATQVEPDTLAVGHTVMSVFQTGRWANGCADDTGWAFSSDSGGNWQHGFLPGLTKSSRPAGPFDRVSDPTIAYNAFFGTWLAAGLDCNGTSPKPDASPQSPAVSVNVSRDGVRWGRAIVAARAGKGQAFDKDWITCDNTPASRFYGNCYLEWDLPSQSDTVVMSTSGDGGLTWSKPTATASHLQGIGGEPVVQPDGTVVVPIIGFVPGVPLVDFRSTNGGRTWSRTTRVADLFQHTFGGNLRGPFFPSVATDGTGRIYITWPDCRFRVSCSANDMVMTTSADGVHWTRVVRIPIDPVTSSADHLGGGLGIDPTTAGRRARLGLFYAYYPDAACTAATCRLFEGFISSTDGGAHWSAPQVIAGPSRLNQLAPAGGPMIGDYQGAAVVPGGNALSAFAVGGIPAGTSQFDEAMYEPSGGAPVTGGSRLARPSGARGFASAKVPRIVR
jgi:hypothetical protein